MKAALAQTHIIWENKKANLEQAQRYIESACNNNAQIIFFPEIFNLVIGLVVLIMVHIDGVRLYVMICDSLNYSR